jgi:hypothetical protein
MLICCKNQYQADKVQQFSTEGDRVMLRLTVFGFLRSFDTAGEILLNVLKTLKLRCCEKLNY